MFGFVFRTVDSALNGLKLVLRHQYVALLFGISCLYEVVLTILDYQMKVIITRGASRLVCFAPDDGGGILLDSCPPCDDAFHVCLCVWLFLSLFAIRFLPSLVYLTCMRIRPTCTGRFFCWILLSRLCTLRRRACARHWFVAVAPTEEWWACLSLALARTQILCKLCFANHRFSGSPKYSSTGHSMTTSRPNGAPSNERPVQRTARAIPLLSHQKRETSINK